MYGRPWYAQAADAVHRLSILAIIGGSIWLAGGLGMTMWANRDKDVKALPSMLNKETMEAFEESKNESESSS